MPEPLSEYEQWLAMHDRELRRVIVEALERGYDLEIIVLAVESPDSGDPKMFSMKNFGDTRREIELLERRTEHAAAQMLGLDPTHRRTIVDEEGNRRDG